MSAAAAVVPARLPGLQRLALRAPVFISDLHLCAAQPATLAAFERLLAGLPDGSAELVILGDLFEYWAGDDALADEPAPDAPSDDDAIGRAVVRALAALAARGVPVFLGHGNRDLLLGARFLQASGAQQLAEPAVARIGTGAAAFDALLSHGDAYCTLDLAYQAFRRQARDAQFQAAFLQRALPERRALIGQGRRQSEAGKQQMTQQIMDVTPEAVGAALREAGVRHLIHGHTHRPARHDFTLDGAPAVRWVLPDWDATATPPRGGGLRWTGTTLEAFAAV